jgi:hypothetical protein
MLNLKHQIMKRIVALVAITICFSYYSKAQKDVSKPNSPKEDIKVNREYDEKGNLIKFDSIYSYSWSGDSTMLQSISPENFQKFFGNHFGNFPDSTFFGNPFFGDIDPFFRQFGGKQDSILLKQFGSNSHFPDFEFRNDSLAMNFKDFDRFFEDFGLTKKDSLSAKSPHQKFNGFPNGSMDEMFKIFEDQMRQMEEQQKEFFKQNPKLKEF